jgi:hypothetical protein
VCVCEREREREREGERERERERGRERGREKHSRVCLAPLPDLKSVGTDIETRHNLLY